MTKIVITLLFGVSVINGAVAAGDAEAGKAKAAVCAACHGANGISASEAYPNLAGQQDAYLVKQLAAFKSGERVDPIMAPMAMGLSSQDMDNLAAYFSALSRTGEQAQSESDTSVASSTAPAATAVLVTKTPTAKLYSGNIKAGQEKSALCVACHATDGNSVLPNHPKLAGQSARYLAKQLSDFKSGARKNPIMAGMAAGLSEEDMHDIASFYAVQTITKGPDATSEIGKKLYLGGDASKKIPACIACHGITGNGMSQAAFPAISSQDAGYLKNQLNAFRDGSRDNDNNSIMRNIAIKLSDSDIEELAKYMASMK
jgi:cytochrome c553